MPASCLFCAIVRGETESYRVYEDELTVVFLYHRPLLAGHCLVVPRTHVDDLTHLPDGLVAPLFGTVRLLSKAVEKGMAAEGSFVAINTKISQSVPHLHVHVVPRRRGDGLRGFFWPRQKYAGPDAMREVQQKVRAAVDRLKAGSA